MLNIIEIDNNNIDYLNKFLLNNLPSTFRYFNTRNIDIIKNHIITIILLDDEVPVGYAHIDYENKYWLGICILEEYQGKGFGKKVMEYIFNNEKIKNINEIYLSVDKINENAIKLYKIFNFKMVEEHENFYIMKNT